LTCKIDPIFEISGSWGERSSAVLIGRQPSRAPSFGIGAIAASKASGIARFAEGVAPSAATQA